MRTQSPVGTVYEFCASCTQCPVAIEANVGGGAGLALRDDFGGKVELTDEQLKDLTAFLTRRFA